MVVDATDLYASVSSQIEEPSAGEGQLTFVVKAKTARPVHVQVEEDPNFTNDWHAVSAQVNRTADATRYAATVPMERDRDFFRTKAIPLQR